MLLICLIILNFLNNLKLLCFLYRLDGVFNGIGWYAQGLSGMLVICIVLLKNRKKRGDQGYKLKTAPDSKKSDRQNCQSQITARDNLLVTNNKPRSVRIRPRSVRVFCQSPITINTLGQAIKSQLSITGKIQQKLHDIFLIFVNKKGSKKVY